MSDTTPRTIRGSAWMRHHCGFFGCDKTTYYPSPPTPVPAGSSRSMNLVGYLEVKGNASSATVTATGHNSWNEVSMAMTQSVSSGVAKANDNSSGTFTIFTARIGTTGTKYLMGTLDVNFIKDGYDNHTSWDAPSGSCASRVAGNGVVKLGTVTMTTSAPLGRIASATGHLSISSNRATFDLPEATATVNTYPREAGVCVATSDAVNGNMAPLTVI